MGIKKVEYKLSKNITPEEAWDKFLDWEEKSREVITTKKIYVDIVDDLIAGILLHQILYWNLPSKTDITKLKVKKNKELWLAKKRSDWYNEIRITKKQYDRAINILRDAYIVETQIFKFDGTPTVHIKINRQVLLGLLGGEKRQSRRKDEEIAAKEKENLVTSTNPIFPKGESRYSPKVKVDIPQRVKSYKHKLHTKIKQTIHSKECISDLKNQIADGDVNNIQDDSLDDDEKLTFTLERSGQKHKPNSLAPSEVAPVIKTSRKNIRVVNNFTNKSNKKKTYDPCPIKYEPYMEAWEKYSGHTFRGMNGAYSKGWKQIQKAVLGKLFNREHTPTIGNQFFGYILTLDDFIYAMKNFNTMLTNVDYYPKNKKGIKSLSLETFLYNPFNPSASNRSCFLNCLSEKPKPLVDTIKDPDPEYTAIVIEIFQKRLEMDLSNEGKRHAIGCTKKLSQFFEQYSDKIPLFNSQYSFIYQQIDALIDMLEDNATANKPILPIYLHSDLTYNKLLPDYLKRIGAIQI